MNEQENAVLHERMRHAIDASREAVLRTRELIERAQAAIDGSEHAVAGAETTVTTMSDVRGTPPSPPHVFC